MVVRCPHCKHHIPLCRLRPRFTCGHCGNPLRAYLSASVLTFTFMFIVVNGFLGLVWRALSMPPPAPAQGPAGGSSAEVTAPVLPSPHLAAMPGGAAHWFEYTVWLLLLGAVLSWGLFQWVFATLVQVVLDEDRLPGGRPRHRRSGRHYSGGTSTDA